MPKQTVEKAARYTYDVYTIAYANDEEAYIEGAKFGSEWQKQQGVEWILLPTSDLPVWGIPVLLYVGDESIIGRRVHGLNGSSNWSWVRDHDGEAVKPTHFAYITLPDKNEDNEI